MQSAATLSYAAQQVHAHDRERFITALFVPAQRRDDLLALYAFYGEAARIRLAVKEAMAGMIRLQWWREVLSGQREAEASRHPVAAPLLACQQHYALPFDLFDEILLAREWELTSNGFSSIEEAIGYGRRTAGALAGLALSILGQSSPDLLEQARQTGAGAALIGLARSLPHHLAQGWNPVPAQFSELADNGESLKIIAKSLGDAGLHAMPPRTSTPRWAIPAMACGLQARSHAALMQKLGWNVLDMRVSLPRPCIAALAWAMLRGRI